jgi:hypothetical protein
MIRFEVEDTGSGIAEELRGRLFQPYELLRPSKGTGLGLSLSKLLLELMGGCIGVRHLPGGTVFWGRLPFVPVPREAQRLPLELAAPCQEINIDAGQRAWIEGARLLAAEDNPLNMTLLRRFLRKLGFLDANIVEAYDGQQAVDACMAGKFDVVLMVRAEHVIPWLTLRSQDCQMPKLTGYALALADK